ncbi:hypothetical protein FPK46_29120, partial [Acinetobacter baumannii]|nr:hypothetical protein [Acinetobacter baumannii]
MPALLSALRICNVSATSCIKHYFSVRLTYPYKKGIVIMKIKNLCLTLCASSLLLASMAGM